MAEGQSPSVSLTQEHPQLSLPIDVMAEGPATAGDQAQNTQSSNTANGYMEAPSSDSIPPSPATIPSSTAVSVPTPNATINSPRPAVSIPVGDMLREDVPEEDFLEHLRKIRDGVEIVDPAGSQEGNIMVTAREGTPVALRKDEEDKTVK